MRSLTRLIAVVAMCVTTFLLLSCASSGFRQGYGKIEFCWTSEHAMSPMTRQISIAYSADEAMQRIQRWVEQTKGGHVLERNNDAKTLVISAGAEPSYAAAKSIAESEWRAYDANTYREWRENEFQSLVELMRQQTEVSKTDHPARYLKAKLNRREVQYTSVINRGTTLSPMYMPSFKVYSPTSGGIRTTTLPGHIISIPTDKYEKRIDRIALYSILEVYVSENESSGATVYAKSAPIDDSTSIVADYGNSIDYAFWSAIKPTDEAKLVEELLTFLMEGGEPLAVEEIGSVEAAVSSSSTRINAKELLDRGDALLKRKRDQEALETYTLVIEMPDAPVDLKAQAYHIRSIIYGRKKKYDRSVADSTAIIDMIDPPVKFKVDAYYFRAIHYSSLGKIDDARSDCTQAMNMPGISADQKSRVLKICSRLE